MTVRTRFAPSPTGYLHIGGVRTALFNWLLARKEGGAFILRVDDTDQQRNVDEALQPILDGFRWLGLDWDEGPEVGGDAGPYFQSQRGDLYRQAVDGLLRAGAAYRDFATPDELQAERDQAQQEGRAFTYSRRWMAETERDAEQFISQGRPGVVRLKMPRAGELVVDDLILGEVTFAWASEQDHVIQRADGSCLYHLATAIDDYAMKISHVVRAEEHLPNTPRQIFIAQSLGYPLPRFAHLPYVAEPGSKSKLSKRKLDKYLKNADFAALRNHGQRIADRLGLAVDSAVFNPVIVDFYERIGFLPDAILNYLLLLGWSLDGEREEFTREEMIEHFTLAGVNRAPASFDPKKLAAFQDREMQKLPLKRKMALCLGFLQRAGLVTSPPPCEIGPYVGLIVEAAGDRIKAAGDILDYDDFFTADDDIAYDVQAFEKRISKPAAARPLLQAFADVLEGVAPFTSAAIDAALHAFIEERGVKIGDVIHALRVAATGKAVGFGVFETLAILGRERSLRRIRRALAWKGEGEEK